MKLATHLGVVAALSLGTPAHPAESLSLSRQELPADRNAYTLWTNALPLLALPEDRTLHDAFDLAWNLNTNMPTGQVRRQLDAWLESKKSPMALFSRGIARGNLQLPAFDLDNFSKAFPIGGLRDAARLKTILARKHAEAGEGMASEREFAEVFRMGQLIAAGDGAMIHYAVGTLVQSLALNGFRWLSSRGDVPPDVLRQVLRDLPAPRAEDTVLANVFRTEYAHFVVPEIRKMEQSASSRTNYFPIRITGVLDVTNTILLAEMFFARFVTNAFTPWASRDPSIESDARALTVLDGVTNADGFFMDLMMWPLEKSDKSARKWKQLEDLGRKQPNILGRLLVSMTMPAGTRIHERSVRDRTDISLTRAFVSLQFVRRNTGQLPESLEDARRAALLEDSPIDFFSGKPVLYSRAKGILWSVGPDGMDDGGDSKKDFVIALPGKK